MTATVLMQLPLAVGGALAVSLGRAARWGLAQYARAPLSNTAILALATVSVMATSNALYSQDHRHPAPLFGVVGPEATEIAPIPAPPVARPVLKVLPTRAAEVPVEIADPNRPIGNAEVFELQRKLQSFGLFEGTVDGWYGPKTAGAIRRFEAREGLKQKGELTPEILKAILAASIISSEPAAPTVRAPEPVMELPVEPRAIEPAAPTNRLPTLMTVPALKPQAQIAPLAAPAPLVAAPAPAVAVAAERPLPQSADEVLEIAANVAGDAIDAIVATVNGDLQLGPTRQAMPPKIEPQVVATPAKPTVADPVAELVTASMTPVATSANTPREVDDPKTIARVQRGLASLGFLRGEIDGVPGEATAKAIRNFEVWNNYDITGRVTPELLALLVAAGADT